MKKAIATMDLSDLKVFEAVLRHGSMNRAAQELHTVQSNVTARMRALEDELGIKLFHRHARGVTTTAAGQRLHPFAERIAALVAEAAAAAKDDGTPGGALQLGSQEVIGTSRLSPVLIRYAQEFPQVRLVLRTGTTPKLLDDVVASRLDGAFVTGPIDHPALHQDMMQLEELVLVTTPQLRAVEDLSGVANLRMLVFDVGCAYRQRLESLLTSLGIVTAEPMVFASLDALIACASARVGVTILPRSAVASAGQEGRVAVHELPVEYARAETLFVRRVDANMSSALSAFLDLAQKEFGPLLPRGQSERTSQPVHDLYDI